MRRLPIALALFAASCTELPEAAFQEEESGWTLRPSGSYYHARTFEEKSPEALFAHAAALQEQKRHAEAASAFGALADSARDPALRANALFSRGQVLMLAGLFSEAYRDFERFLTRYPDSDPAPRAKQYLMESALALAESGQREGILGVPLYTSTETGVKLLKNALQKYPREAFSDDYLYRLAEYRYRQGDLDGAETELKQILDDPTYRRSNSAPRALLLLGRIGLERYEGVNYDHKPLIDAKRVYEQFELDYKRYEDDPEKAAELGLRDLPAMLAAARAGIAYVDEKLAERELALADYYESRDRGAAAIYLRAVCKNFPRTKSAEEARKRLAEMGVVSP